MKKCFVIINPHSGKENKEAMLNYLKDELIKNEYEVEFYYTKSANDATKKVENLENCDLVLSIGGDGTLNEVISGMQARKKVIPLGFLPTGTTNDVATMFGYTKNYKKNIDMLLNGTVKKIDTCFINTHPYLYVACIGNYMEVAYNTPRDLKKKFGRIAYIFEALKKTIKPIKTINMNYTIDNVTKSGKFSFIFITNSSRIAGVKNVLPDVLLDDNKFEVFLCTAKSKSEALRYIMHINKNKLRDNHQTGFLYYKTDNLKIEFNEYPSFSWCLDGEELKLDTLTYNFSVNQKIYLLIPNINSELFEKNVK